MSLLKTIAISAVAHAAVLGGIVVLKTPEHKNTESIGVMLQQKKKPKPDEDKPKPIEAPPELLHKSAFKAPPKAAPEPPPPDPAPQQHAALNAMPDYGINMAGMAGPGGPGIGVGIPVGPGGGNSRGVNQLTAAPPKEKSFGTVKEAIQGDSPCTEELIKPKPQGFAQPQYTDEARSAEVEGRVKLKLTVDSAGNVTDVQVLTGLGHGLDESSIATAKRIKFNPGTACSKPVSSSFVITFRFALGE
jgi:periplasmic protein TonB